MYDVLMELAKTNKEYSIPISNEEYFDLLPGDLLEVYYYEGAFNIPYFIHYNEKKS